MWAVFAFVCLIPLIVGIVIANENMGGNILWESLGIAFAIASLLCFIGFMSLQVTNNRKKAQKGIAALKQRVIEDCLPYAATHVHENGNYIVYACANDNKIKVLKK